MSARIVRAMITDVALEKRLQECDEAGWALLNMTWTPRQQAWQCIYRDPGDASGRRPVTVDVPEKEPLRVVIGGKDTVTVTMPGGQQVIVSVAPDPVERAWKGY